MMIFHGPPLPLSVLSMALCLSIFLTPSLFSAEEEHGAEVRISPEAMRQHGVELGEAGPGVIYKSVGGPGEILLNEDKVAHLSPRVPGVAVKVLKSFGDKVSEGETLAVLESSALGEAKIDYHTSKTKLELARLDHERSEKVYQNTKSLLTLLKSGMGPSEIAAKTENQPVGEVKTRLLAAYSQSRQLESAFNRSDKLQSKGVVSVADLELKSKEKESAQAAFKGAMEDVELGMEQSMLKSRRELMLAETAMANAERRLNMLGLSNGDIAALEKDHADKHVSVYLLKSTINGVVIERHLAVGEMVGPESNCFTVADLSSVWCDIRIRPKDMRGLAKGGKALVKADSGDFAAEITAVSPTIEDKTRSGFVRVSVDNPGGALKPGLFVEGKVMVSEKKVGLVVPAEAVQVVEGRDVVFKTGCGENEFAAQHVQKGETDGLGVEILDGLKAGDKIVKKGAFLLKAELAKGKAEGCAGGH